MTVTLAVPEVATVSQIEVSPAGRDPRRRLTRLPVSKLPSRPDLPGPVASYPELSDQDIATGHRESALDQMLLALAV